MIYTLQHKEEIAKFLSTTLTEASSKDIVAGEYYIDNSTGITYVRSESADRFEVSVPVYNLKIGDKVKATAQIKLISGARPQLSNTAPTTTFDAYGGEGIARLISLPTLGVSDFQTVELEVVYEGFTFNGTTVSTSNNAYGVLRFRLYAPPGYSYNFAFKNFKIETSHSLSGLSPSTRIYTGGLSTTASGATLTSSGTFNKRDMTVSTTDGSTVRINFNRPFYVAPRIFLENTVQLDGNSGKYELKVGTITTTDVYLRLVNNETFTQVPLNTLPYSVFTQFLIIGE